MYTDASGNLVAEDHGAYWSRPSYKKQTISVTKDNVGAGLEDNNPASYDRIINNTVQGNLDLTEKLVQATAMSDAEVVKQAMQTWRDTFDQETKDVIEKSEVFQQTQAADYQPNYVSSDVTGNEIDTDQQGNVNTVNRADAEALVKQSILLGLDPEARNLYESGDRTVQRRVDEQINNAVRMMLNSDNSFEQYQQLQNQVNAQMTNVSNQQSSADEFMEAQTRANEIIDRGGQPDGGQGGDLNQVGGTTQSTTTTPDGEIVSEHYNFGGYNTASWSNIYRSFLDKTLGSSPQAYQYAEQQGLGNDPLQRRVHTQFLLQATEEDPWAGDLTGDTLRSDGVTPGKVYSGIGDEHDTSRNPYAEFLEGYTPYTGDRLLSTVKDVISTMKTFKTNFDHTGNTTYSDRDLRDFRWRDRFLYDSKADQNQQALAALPIMDSSPLALRSETSSILQRLHDRWAASPNRNTEESWLEYVDRNNYFGMIDRPQKVETSYSGDIQD